MIFSIIVFIIVLGLLIFVHELGHFLIAKLSDIKVEDFAFGFPPRLFSKMFRGTRYSVNLIPIGGYVKLLGEDDQAQDPRAFSKKKVPVRLAVVIAGVLMNYLLAIVMFAAGFAVGMTPYFSDPKSLGGTKQPVIFVSDVVADSPAQKVGIKPGQQIVGFDSAFTVQQFTASNAGKKVSFEIIDENGKSRSVEVTLGKTDQAQLGVALFETAKIKLPLVKALIAGAKEATLAAEFTFKFFGNALIKLFSRGEVPQEIGGPVAIFGVTAQAVAQGLVALLRIVGLLSVNLAILNIVPFPALDGGKALFLVVEGLFGRRVLKYHHEALIHTIGFVILVALILAITYRDIVRLQ